MNRPLHEKLSILDQSHLFYMVSYIDRVVHHKVLVLMRHSEPGTRNCMQMFELDTYKTLIKRWATDDLDETEIWLLCYKSFKWQSNYLSLRFTT